MTDLLHVRANGRVVAYMMASATEAGVWHTVTPRWCDCKGFAYRRRCRHIAAARAYIDAVREPMPANLVIRGLQGMAAQRGETTVFDRFRED
jgi:hypothetical protein